MSAPFISFKALYGLFNLSEDRFCGRACSLSQNADLFKLIIPYFTSKVNFEILLIVRFQTAAPVQHIPDAFNHERFNFNFIITIWICYRAKLSHTAFHALLNHDLRYMGKSSGKSRRLRIQCKCFLYTRRNGAGGILPDTPELNVRPYPSVCICNVEYIAQCKRSWTTIINQGDSVCPSLNPVA